MSGALEVPARVLYVAGHGRSGSTLLERLLGQLPGCVSVGELRHLWARDLDAGDLCGCGEPLGRCVFWRDVLGRAIGGVDAERFAGLLELRGRVDRVRHVPAMVVPWRGRAHARDLARYSDVALRTYHALLAVSGAEVVVDGSKDVSTLCLLARLESVDLRVVHLVRDCRAVAHSWMRRKRRPEVTGREVYMRSYRPRETAVEWCWRNALIEAARPWLGGYLRLRYEDFVRDPATALAGVLALAGISDGEAARQLVKDGRADLRRVTHTVSGNPMRFQRGPVEIALDDEWRRAMSASDRRTVTALAWPLLWRYGYLGRGG